MAGLSPAAPVRIIGAGPAGLMAAECLAQAGLQVDVYDAMPSVGRKFLLAGRGGLNLTHSEPFDRFITRYAGRLDDLGPAVRAFDPQQLCEWVHGLGVQTFVGSSGRVFPTDMKAAPLLRAWLLRLREAGVRFHMRHRWHGWTEAQQLRFDTPDGPVLVAAEATVLALGGGSWARLGSDGAWTGLLAERGIQVAPLQPANCGFECAWSDHFKSRFAGAPLQAVGLRFTDATGRQHSRTGEFVITATGVEGSLIYALSAPLRDTITAQGHVDLELDLAPGLGLQRVQAELAWPRGTRSMANHLRSRVRIEGVKAGLLREHVSAQDYADVDRLAAAIKALPLRLTATRPIDEAISTAGGVDYAALDAGLMLKAMPGVFCAGEMLDWEAPTGGYLLTACFATGRQAAHGVQAWLARKG